MIRLGAAKRESRPARPHISLAGWLSASDARNPRRPQPSHCARRHGPSPVCSARNDPQRWTWQKRRSPDWKSAAFVCSRPRPRGRDLRRDRAQPLAACGDAELGDELRDHQEGAESLATQSPPRLSSFRDTAHGSNPVIRSIWRIIHSTIGTVRLNPRDMSRCEATGGRRWRDMRDM